MAERKNTLQIRQKIILAADQLFYQQGYNLCSFSDIANASSIPRGNLNYYFKNKEQILEAVIDYRIVEMKKMLSQWQLQYKTPILRLQRYVQILANVKDEVIQFGCPMATLNSELAKIQPKLQNISIRQFEVFEFWIKKQFQDMGCSRNASDLTTHLLIRTQGISTMAYIKHNARFIKHEVGLINHWLESLNHI